MTWIFQAIPKRYDLRTELEPGRTDTWLVTRYRGEMSDGDIVYFWMAGEEDSRGLYGWGRIAEPAPKFYSGWGHGIKVRYEGRYEPHVSIRDVRAVPELQAHVLIRMPIGTNFKLTPQQDAALRRLISKKLGPGAVPHE